MIFLVGFFAFIVGVIAGGYIQQALDRAYERLIQREEAA